MIYDAVSITYALEELLLIVVSPAVSTPFKLGGCLDLGLETENKLYTMSLI